MNVRLFLSHDIKPKKEQKTFLQSVLWRHITILYKVDDIISNITASSIA